MTDLSMYDPERPWISGPDDDPSRANWAAEFFNPSGETRQPVFLRGQLLLAIFRLMIVIAALATAMGGSPLIGAAIAFAGIGILLIMSLINHVRRLHYTGRSPFWALLIALPLMLATAFAVQGAQQIPAQIAQMGAMRDVMMAARESAQTEGQASAESAEEAAETETAAPPPQRRAMQRRGPPPTEQQMLTGVISGSIGIWFLASLVGMLFSLLFVARKTPA